MLIIIIFTEPGDTLAVNFQTQTTAAELDRLMEKNASYDFFVAKYNKTKDMELDRQPLAKAIIDRILEITNYTRPQV